MWILEYDVQVLQCPEVLNFHTPLKNTLASVIYYSITKHLLLFVNLQCIIVICTKIHEMYISSLPRSKGEMRLSNSFIVSFNLDFLRSSSMSKFALQSVGKILDILQLFHMIWGLIPLHIIACLMALFFLVSSRKIKLRENPFQKLLLILNFEWRNYPLLQFIPHL